MRLHKGRLRISRKTARRLVRSVFVFLVLFGLTNLAVWGVYHGRTYPNTYVGAAGVSYGSRDFDALSQFLVNNKFVPTTIKVSSHGKTETVDSQALKATLDTKATVTAIRDNRTFLPVVDLLRRHVVVPVFTFDDDAMQAAAQRLSQSFYTVPTDARLVQNEGVFKLEAAKNGYLVSRDTVSRQLSQALGLQKRQLDIKPQIQAPNVKTADLEDEYRELVKQQQTLVTFSYDKKSVTTSAAAVGGWYVVDGNRYELSAANIRAYIIVTGQNWGIEVENLDAATAEAQKAVAAAKPVTIVLKAAPKRIVKSYTYCTAVRGVEASLLGALNPKLATTYADGRGWSLGGQVGFSKVEAGCNFTVWLTAASQMASFGSICDAEWSCRVGSNVVINFDRWQGASASWNAAGGSLDDYRSMVINHETGHWFEFYHSSCGGAGQPAPVMQQQSIDLQGCTFNPWPTAAEQAALRRSLGI